MRKLFCSLLLLGALLSLLLPTALPAHAQGNDPIYGLWFYQPPTSAVKIVYYLHQEDTVTDADFGTQYTDAATQGCLRYVPSVFLVRYRDDPTIGWEVRCYTDETVYVVIAGSVFGQDIIDAAVCRAQQMVYDTCIGRHERTLEL